MASQGTGGSGPKSARRPSAAEETWIGRHEAEDAPAGPTAAFVPALTVLHHPDPERIGERASLERIGSGVAQYLSRTSPAFAPYPSDPRVEPRPLLDQALSRRPIRMAALADGGIRIELGECRTRVHVRGEPLRDVIELSADDVRQGVVIELADRVVLLLHHASAVGAGGAFSTQAEATSFPDLVGESAPIRRLRHDIRRVADLDVPVLVRGETGSGKELVAQAIHQASARRAAPLVAVNLGAIPASLAISALFGAEKASYTGADRRQIGYFQRAQGGTLFLDEIGEAPSEVQVGLLRALETGEVQGVGGQPQKIDVRIIAATDVDLEWKIEEGDFRAPLLHRLASYEIWLPPLRERRDDIGRLLIRFFREELGRVGEASHLAPPPAGGDLWLRGSLVARLADFDWPGNVRQLRNVVRQIVIHSRGRKQAELPPSVERQLAAAPPRARPSLATPAAPAAPPADATPAAPAAPPADAAPAAPPADAAPLPAVTPWVFAESFSRRRPGEVSEEELVAALREARWDRKAAAALLRVSKASLYQLLHKNPRFRTARDLTADEISRAWYECDGDVDRMVDRLEVSERALRQRLRDLGLGAR